MDHYEERPLKHHKVTPAIMPDATNYKSVEEYAPKYRFMRIPLNNLTGTSVQISASTQQLLEFKLPIATYNLSKSFLYYQEQFSATTGLGGGTNANFSFEDTVGMISNAYFGTGGGLGICDLPYCNNWIKTQRPAKTKLQDFLTHDVPSGLYPSSNLAVATYYAYNQNILPYPYTIQAGNMWAAGSGATRNSPLSNTEPIHLDYGAYEAGGSQSILNRPRIIPLNAIADTIYDMDRDWYFPIEMYSRFMAGPGGKMGFTDSDVAAPGTAPTLPNTITLYNIYLFLAIEQNEIIIKSIENKVKSGGMKVQIPYTQAFRYASSTTAVNFQIPLSSQYGKRLKRMVWTVFNGALNEMQNTAYDNSNWNGAKITQYQTYLDARPLQDFQMSCLQPSITALATNQTINGDDWRENQRFLKDSVIQNYAQYQLNWRHQDYFYEPNRKTNIPEENIDEGLDMDTTHLWQVQAVAANANPIVNYNYATFVRDLIIHPQGAPELK